MICESPDMPVYLESSYLILHYVITFYMFCGLAKGSVLWHQCSVVARYFHVVAKYVLWWPDMFCGSQK
jgi:hypothetical protein